jgi:hydrogenase maturation protease
MTEPAGSVLLYGYGNPGRGDDGLGPALAAAVEELALPGVAVDANYQLAVEDAAELGRFAAVIFADAAVAGPAPFWFSRIAEGRAGHLGFTSHSVTPEQVVALARALFGSQVPAYTLGIRGYAWGELVDGLSEPARENLGHAVAFARKALAERQFEDYVQEYGYLAVGDPTGGTTWKA